MKFKLPLQESDSDSGGLRFEYVGISNHLEYIHSNLAKSEAPDWLRFLSRMSYWVPLMPSLKVGEYAEVKELQAAARKTI